MNPLDGIIVALENDRTWWRFAVELTVLDAGRPREPLVNADQVTVLRSWLSPSPQPVPRRRHLHAVDRRLPAPPPSKIRDRALQDDHGLVAAERAPRNRHHAPQHP